MVLIESDRSEWADERLDRLTGKERDVLNLVLERRTSKEIARQLNIVPNTVDLRLRTAKEKLCARDRNDAARIYGELLGACGKTTCGPTVISQTPTRPVAAPPEHRSARFTLHDAASFELSAPWEASQPTRLSEDWDYRFGRVWRIAAIPLGALGIALLALALIAIATNLGMLI